jgi:hypothetical protein
MNKKTCKALISAGIAFGLGLLGVPTVSYAATVTYVQTTQGCTGGCGISANNTVQVSDTVLPTLITPLAGGVFDIYVTLDTSTATPWSFMKNAGDKTTGHSASFAFSSSLNPLTLTVIAPGSNFSPNSINPMPAYAMAPFDFPANGYGLSTDQQKVYSTLDFHVDTGNSSLTLAQFVATLLASTDSPYPIFAADVYSGITGNTGIIGFTQTNNEGPPPVPLPGALPLFTTGLGALGLLGWRRKRKAAARAA